MDINSFIERIIQNFVCGICHHNFTEAEDYFMHLQIHDKPNKVKPIVERNIDAPETINLVTEDDKNEPIEKGSPCFLCTQCDFSFTDEIDLECHIKPIIINLHLERNLRIQNQAAQLKN